jgi:hypothetical protein
MTSSLFLFLGVAFVAFRFFFAANFGELFFFCNPTCSNSARRFISRPMRSLPFGEKMPQMPQKRKRSAFGRQSSSVPSVFS